MKKKNSASPTSQSPEADQNFCFGNQCLTLLNCAMSHQCTTNHLERARRSSLKAAFNEEIPSRRSTPLAHERPRHGSALQLSRTRECGRACRLRAADLPQRPRSSKVANNANLLMLWWRIWHPRVGAGRQLRSLSLHRKCSERAQPPSFNLRSSAKLQVQHLVCS